MKILSMNHSKPLLIKQALLIIGVFGLVLACKKTDDSSSKIDCSGPAKSFSADVKPIMQLSCAFDSDCHGSSSNSGPGSLVNYSEIFTARSSIRSVVLSGTMPKGGSLTASEKNAIICWIDNAAPNN